MTTVLKLFQNFILATVLLTSLGCAETLTAKTPADPTISWAVPSVISYGTSLSSSQLNATASVGGTYSYSPASGTVLTAGTHTLTVTFTPYDTTDYNSATDSVSITVNPATPTISWSNPAEITFGTGLSSAQLDATSSVPGTFSYMPAARAVLGVGTQTLTVTFTPTDTTDYITTTATVGLSVVLPPAPRAPRLPDSVCTPPTEQTIPSNHTVVGDGSPSSCTATGLQAAVANGGYITFDCGGNTTIPITTQIEVSTEPTVIDGGGAITLDGGGVSRILYVDAFESVSVRNLTFRNGYGGESPGGEPTAYLDPNFENTSGGAIKGAYLNPIEVINSVFENNVGFFGSGGAIFSNSGGTLTVTGSVFDQNKGGIGGAIFGMVSDIDINNSTFTNNGFPRSSDTSSTWYPMFGGAVSTDGASGSSTNPHVTICGSNFANNSAPTNGGALYIWLYAPDTFVLDRSTFANNTVWQGPDGYAYANGDDTIYARGGAADIGMGYSNTGGVVGNMTVSNSTFISNASDIDAGGVALFSDGGPTQVFNSTFYNNSAATGSDLTFDGWSSPVWQNPTPYLNATNDTFANGKGNTASLSLSGPGFIINDSAFLETGSTVCDTVGTGSSDLQYSSGGSTTSCISGSILTSNPELASPARNGGPTLTMLPASNSPLVGSGTNCEPTDQRGVARNTLACTIGAVEVK